jgi:hypothetical protein
MLRLLKIISPKSVFFFWGTMYFSTGTVQNFYYDDKDRYVYVKGTVNTKKIN